MSALTQKNIDETTKRIRELVRFHATVPEQIEILKTRYTAFYEERDAGSFASLVAAVIIAEKCLGRA